MAAVKLEAVEVVAVAITITIHLEEEVGWQLEVVGQQRTLPVQHQHLHNDTRQGVLYSPFPLIPIPSVQVYFGRSRSTSKDYPGHMFRFSLGWLNETYICEIGSSCQEASFTSA